jgi:hypothetical protein
MVLYTKFCLNLYVTCEFVSVPKSRIQMFLFLLRLFILWSTMKCTHPCSQIINVHNFFIPF